MIEKHCVILHVRVAVWGFVDLWLVDDEKDLIVGLVSIM
jgi:hypothetical protein